MRRLPITAQRILISAWGAVPGVPDWARQETVQEEVVQIVLTERLLQE
jgi:hypothetical protein